MDKKNINNVKLGKDVKIFDFTNLYGCEIGDGTKVGTFVEIQKNAYIGKNCKISSHTFICEGVHIGDNVFVGHNVTFINDKYPRATNENGSLQTEADWKVEETFVGNGVSIGSSSTIRTFMVLRLPAGVWHKDSADKQNGDRRGAPG